MHTPPRLSEQPANVASRTRWYILGVPTPKAGSGPSPSTGIAGWTRGPPPGHAGGHRRQSFVLVPTRPTKTRQKSVCRPSTRDMLVVLQSESELK